MRNESLYVWALLSGIWMVAGCGQGSGHDAMNGSGEQHDKGMAGMKKDTGMKGMAMDSMKMGHESLVVGMDDFLRPGNSAVLSSVPVTAMHQETLTPVVNAFGTVAYDTRRLSTVSARVSGRIERLYVRYRYQHVHQGQRIMDLYSPELATGEQELLFLLKNDPGNAAMIEAARERLRLLGVGAQQLADVERTGKASPMQAVYSNYEGHIHEAGNTMPETGAALPGAGGSSGASGMTQELPVKEGMYVEKGQPVFQVFNMDRSWVVLSVFPGDAALVKPGDAVRVVPETAPGQAFDARVDEVLPFFGKDARTLSVRVYFDNSLREIPIGSQVKANVRVEPVKGDWLPEQAVLSLGADRVVFLKEGNGFRARRVATGARLKGLVQVQSGLGAADSVAANAQFLVDSEDFIKVKE